MAGSVGGDAMKHESEGPVALAVAPELPYLDALFLPDLDRARTIGRVLALLDRIEEPRNRAVIDLGTSGLDARRTARRLADRGAGRAFVIRVPHGRTAGDILAAAMGDAGLEVE